MPLFSLSTLSSRCHIGLSLVTLAWTCACGAPQDANDNGSSASDDTDSMTAITAMDTSSASGFGDLSTPTGDDTQVTAAGEVVDVDEDCGANVTAVIRDFQEVHPDFEAFLDSEMLGGEPGILAPGLDAATRKPVYVGGEGRMTTGAANFNQWYNDVEGVNMSKTFKIPFTSNGDGTVTYDNPAFFPIDGEMFGNELNGQAVAHNFHFTTELHTEFRYNGGEIFRFTGDDDLWVFINNQLVIDLGGVHESRQQGVELDDIAADLNMVPGNIYPMDLFHAERKAWDSNFRIDSSLEFTKCTPLLQ